MKTFRTSIAVALSGVALLGFVTSPVVAAQGKGQHDREFWRAISRNHYALPQGQPIFPLVRELSGYLGSTDPELRDDLAYSILESWIVEQGQLSTPELLSLADEWQGNLRMGIGESGTDTVFNRSFSVLGLAALAERDLKTPFLGEERYRAMFKNALTYLREERDLRGFDPVKGWIHATAHTADLLAELANNPLLKVEDQGQILEAITQRLSSANEIFSHEEQHRLAFVAATIVVRKDFDAAAFQRWLAHVDATDQRVFKDSPPKLDLLRTFENDTYFFVGLVTNLQMESPNAAVSEAQKAIIQKLRSR